MIHLGDITKINWSSVPPVDVVTGGSPCQDLSIAGRRAGLAGERSGLYIEQIRCIKELRDADVKRGISSKDIRPRYMVWENVPGAFSSNKGEDFRVVLEEAARVVEPNAVIPEPPKGKWSNSGAILGNGWSLAWRVHDAQFWGVPQRRRRISLVCDFGGLSAPEILFERKGVSWNPQESGAQREEAAGGTGDSVDETGRCLTGWDCQSKRIFNPDAVCGTLNSGTTEGVNIVPCVYDARGNGDGKTVCTITGDHQNRVTDYTALCIGNGQANQSVSDKAGALAAGAHPPAVAIGNGRLNQISMAEQANTLDTMHDQQAVMVPDVAHTLKAKANCDFRADSENYPVQNSVVRRLTPLECERLQGYPDGWTDIGEWVDSKGKKHKPADSPRYKALGNSIALPFWSWLLRRISAQYYRPATLGSLFDGIGGFPLVWEQINGGDSALWASEIEEFPIAVTKARFSS